MGGAHLLEQLELCLRARQHAVDLQGRVHTRTQAAGRLHHQPLQQLLPLRGRAPVVEHAGLRAHGASCTSAMIEI